MSALCSILSTQHGSLVPVELHGLAAHVLPRDLHGAVKKIYETKISISYSLPYHTLFTGPMSSTLPYMKQLRDATSIASELYFIYIKKSIPQQLLQPVNMWSSVFRDNFYVDVTKEAY